MHVAPAPQQPPSCPQQMERVRATTLFVLMAVALGACDLVCVCRVHTGRLARTQGRWCKSAGCERSACSSCLQTLSLYAACIGHMHMRVC